MKRLGEVKTQIDRWPLVEGDNAPHVLTVVILCPFKGKPLKEDIARVIDDAAAITRDMEIK